MVMNDDEPELDDDAKKLLVRAEQRLRKREPEVFATYENEAWTSGDDDEGAKRPT